MLCYVNYVATGLLNGVYGNLNRNEAGVTQ